MTACRRAAGLVALAGCLAGCSPAYVLRAGYEEAKILWRRQPIERMLQQPEIDPPLRAQLELALAARAYAAGTLRLRAGKSYTSYARVDADQAVHVVTAAHQFKLEPYTWWFPFVGRVPYKGYFSEAQAQAEAAALERDGYDTSVRPSVAFSTLGWFADPLLSTVARYDRVTLVNVVIHELVHNTAYFPGQTTFNESFANFVGHRGAIEFFAQRGDEPAYARAVMAWDDTLRFSDFLDGFVERLEQAYARGITLDERERLFAAAQDECRQLGLRTTVFDDFMGERLNNAVLLQYRMYTHDLRIFDALVDDAGGDLAQAIRRVLAAARAAADPFDAVRRLPDVPGDKLTGKPPAVNTDTHSA